MPYYQGDFYGPGGRGGYYRGDPGFFSFLGGLAKSAVGMIPGVGGALAKILPHAPVSSTGGMIGRVGPIVTKVGAAIAKHPVLSAAGAAGAVGMIGAAAGRATAGGVPMKGFHISSKTGKLVRNKHMRVTNPKALRRSLRRVAGFARVARRVLHFTHPRAARGAPRYRFAKKRRAA